MSANNKTLTRAEEDIMQALWKLEKGFIKDVVDQLPEPRPHYNTVSTIIKILHDKGFVGFESFGKANRYFPLVKKEDYSRKTMGEFVKKYFGNSYHGMVSFFAKEKDITIKELEEILSELKKQQ